MPRRRDPAFHRYSKPCSKPQLLETYPWLLILYSNMLSLLLAQHGGAISTDNSEEGKYSCLVTYSAVPATAPSPARSVLGTANRLSSEKAPDEVRGGELYMCSSFSARASRLELPSCAWPAPSNFKRISSELLYLRALRLIRLALLLK